MKRASRFIFGNFQACFFEFCPLHFNPALLKFIKG